MTGLLALAIALGILAVPAVLRARRFRAEGRISEARFESTRAGLAVAGTIALVALALMTKGRPA